MSDWHHIGDINIGKTWINLCKGKYKDHEFYLIKEVWKDKDGKFRDIMIGEKRTKPGIRFTISNNKESIQGWTEIIMAIKQDFEFNINKEEKKENNDWEDL